MPNKPAATSQTEPIIAADLRTAYSYALERRDIYAVGPWSIAIAGLIERTSRAEAQALYLEDELRANLYAVDPKALKEAVEYAVHLVKDGHYYRQRRAKESQP